MCCYNKALYINYTYIIKKKIADGLSLTLDLSSEKLFKSILKGFRRFSSLLYFW